MSSKPQDARLPPASTQSEQPPWSSHTSGRGNGDEERNSTSSTVVNNGDADPAAVEKATSKPGQDEKDRKDPNLVDWDGPDDPSNPLNMSQIRKWSIVLVLGSATLCVTCASSMVANTYRGMQQDFGISHEVATLALTLFIGGLGLGPLFLAPLSEFFGRTPIYLIGYIVYTAFSFLVAFGNLPGLLIGRFIQGVAGSAFLSVVGGSVTDMWPGTQVAKPMAVITTFPFAGPCLGPILSGFINQALHWRWTWYVCTIWTFVELVAIYLFVPETYAPKILRRKAQRLRKETGNNNLRSRREQEEIDQNINIPRYVFLSIGRPFEILIKEPMALALCLWCALLLGILYAFFSAFVIIYSAKGLNEGQIGLTFLGMLIGILIATGTNITIWPKVYLKTAARLGHKPPPEEHLKKAMVAAVLGPVSLFWFAWTSQPSVHWAASVVASVFFGITFCLAFTASFTYKIDAYRPYAASAMGANSFLRSSFAAAFPLFTNQMYTKLTPVWAGTLIAFLLLAIAPFPFLFFKYGARLRKRSKFSDVS